MTGSVTWERVIDEYRCWMDAWYEAIRWGQPAQEWVEMRLALEQLEAQGRKE